MRSTPHRPTVAGHPGGHASLLARRAAVRLVVAVAGLGLLALIAWKVGLLATAAHGHLTAHQLVGLGILAVPALVLVMVASRARELQAKAAIGARSERRVARTLARLPVTAVGNGLLLGAGGDADHLVLGPCAVVVETKTGFGQVRSDGATLRAGARRIPGNPVGQSRRQAERLGGLLGVPATPIVCVADMTNAPFRVGGTVVCSRTALPDIIARCPAVLTPAAARTALEQISADHVRREAANDAGYHPAPTTRPRASASS